MTNNEITDWVRDILGLEGITLLNGHSDAFIGITYDNRAVYDFNTIYESLLHDGMPMDDALDYIDYNVNGFFTEDSPVILMQYFNDKEM